MNVCGPLVSSQPVLRMETCVMELPLKSIADMPATYQRLCLMQGRDCLAVVADMAKAAFGGPGRVTGAKFVVAEPWAAIPSFDRFINCGEYTFHTEVVCPFSGDTIPDTLLGKGACGPFSGARPLLVRALEEFRCLQLRRTGCTPIVSVTVVVGLGFNVF